MSELNETVYCEALRVFIDTLIKKGGLSSEKAASWMNDALSVGDEIDFMDTSAFRQYQAWLLKDIFSGHPDEWEQLGIDATRYVINYIQSDKESYYLPEYFVDFSKLPEGITADQFLKAFTMKEIFDYLEDRSCWGRDLPLAEYDCRSVAGVFIGEFLAYGGSFVLLFNKFTAEIPNFIDYTNHFFDYVQVAIDLKNAGLPVDLTAVAKSLDSPSFLKSHRLYSIRRYVMDMFDLLAAGAEVDLGKLAAKVKKAKISKQISYDEYLEMVRQLLEAGYEISYNKFAKSVIKDLDANRVFKRQYIANYGHSALMSSLEKYGVEPEIIKELQTKIGAKY